MRCRTRIEPETKIVEQSQNGRPWPMRTTEYTTHSAITVHTRLRTSRCCGVNGSRGCANAPRCQLRSVSTPPSRIIASPSTPGSRPGIVYGLMFCDSSRSIVMDATSTATPKTTQPTPCQKSERGVMSSSSAARCCAGASLMAGRLRLGDAHRVGRDLRLAGGVQVPHVGLHRGEHGLLRRFTRQRVEEGAPARCVLPERVALGDLLVPDLLDGLHDVVGHALRDEDAEVVGGCGEAVLGVRQRRDL